MEMFPLVDRGHIQELVANMSVDKALDVLLNRKKVSSDNSYSECAEGACKQYNE